jgi:hypothetical protein
MLDEVLIETLKKVIVQEIKDYLEDNPPAEYKVYEDSVEDTVRRLINNELEVEVRSL